MSLVLVFNSGSSSVKFQYVDPESTATDTPIVSGLVEQIGEPKGRITIKSEGEEYVKELELHDHHDGMTAAVAFMHETGLDKHRKDAVAVGHRVVHGGRTFSAPALVDHETIQKIGALTPLAPLHNPANISGIKVAQVLLPHLPHVAVFDTGFFNHLPEAAATYAIDKNVAAEHNIRRYGFHGTSHEFVSGLVPELIGRAPEETNQVVLHLGNGASASAIRAGKPIDTSMGLTPLAGLVMGTRSGDVDPGVLLYLLRNGMDVDELDTLLNRRSGLKGLSGVNDFRDVHRLIDMGNDNAKLALEVYLTQLRRIIGGYMIELGRVDAITFTAGVGENDAIVRARAMENLDFYGIKIDDLKNEERSREARVISTEDSTIKVLVVPTNEELAIAQKAAAVAQQQG
ncbi:acetate kinase [Corynebacterium aquatimens]|uniref:Acetate kinase n=1 Tax=Corynebacterium aquatimens TaxID=1190508 RepID=A0A931E395_9CORY|nr:acetate kinase [Corynebacterium aquatimens]MBG6122396.1 acetate kinase [Corynebacterium aquatimens]WJY65061.1 Acetate kinase [Corynebacterium aquatimens]